MSQQLQEKNKEQLNQLSIQELVDIVLTQQEIIKGLNQEIEKLKISRNLDSKISSKPPSCDLLKKPEKKTDSPEQEGTRKKRNPGGQLGHQGKTRKGFGRVDRYEVLKSKECSSCGQLLEMAKSIKIEKQSVAVLVERPIEVVEYQRHHQRCQCCGVVTSPPWSKQIIRPTRPGNKTTRVVGVVRQLWTFTL